MGYHTITWHHTQHNDQRIKGESEASIWNEYLSEIN